MEYDVIIVGAGPAGCRVAELVAKKGYDVLVLEEHATIGKPTQCTGLVSSRIGKLPSGVAINRIKKAKFCSRQECFEIESKKPVYVIDRKKYDQHIYRKAKIAGAKFKLSTRFLDFNNGEVFTTAGNFKSKILVGADGPNSVVAKSIGIKQPDKLLYAVQVKIESHFASSTVELWFGSDTAPGLFAWIVPENKKIARVGLMTDKNPNKYLEKFLKKRFGSVKTFDRIGDVIRYGLIENSAADGVLLVGDAASHIKPFSAGGLVYNQITARYAARACIKALKSKNFSKKFFKKNYDDVWKKELETPIRRGLVIKNLFEKISDKPFTFKVIRNLKITSLANFLDMDFLSKG